jgi:hypothetical protein
VIDIIGIPSSHTQFKRDISKKAVGRIPLPRWGANETSALERLVSDYEQELDSRGPGFETAKGKLLAIDAFILKGYGLSPRLERELLDLFRGLPRLVPFEFSGYFPDEFTSSIPLWMFLSPEYQKCNARYLLSRIPTITDPALIEALEEVAE